MSSSIKAALDSMNALKLSISQYGNVINNDLKGKDQSLATISDLLNTVTTVVNNHNSSNLPHGSTTVGMAVMRAKDAAAARAAIGAVSVSDKVNNATYADSAGTGVDQTARDTANAVTTNFNTFSAQITAVGTSLLKAQNDVAARAAIGAVAVTDKVNNAGYADSAGTAVDQTARDAANSAMAAFNAFTFVY